MPREDRKLLLIEDDPFLIEWIKRLLDEDFRVATKTVVVSSEREFLIKRPVLAESGFHWIILDWMLPWEDGVDVDSIEHPEKRGEHFEAGIRIVDDIAQTPRLASVPILIYSANDLSALDLSRARKLQSTFQRKDQPDRDLLRWMEKFL